MIELQFTLPCWAVNLIAAVLVLLLWVLGLVIVSKLTQKFSENVRGVAAISVSLAAGAAWMYLFMTLC